MVNILICLGDFFCSFSFQEMFVLLTTDVHSYLIMRL